MADEAAPPAPAGGNAVPGGQHQLTEARGPTSPDSMARSEDAIKRAWQKQEQTDPARANNKVRLRPEAIDDIDALMAPMGAETRAGVIYQLIEDGKLKYGKKRKR